MWNIGCRFLWPCHTVLLFVLSLQWEGMKCQDQFGFNIKALEQVAVQKGLCVRIPCSFTLGPGYNITSGVIGIWYKGYNGHFNKKIVAASTDSSRFPDTTNGRFIFTGKVSAGDCSFSISDAQPGDTERYQLRLEGSQKHNYLAIQPFVFLTDLKEPDISPTEGLIAGEEVTLTCTAPTNCPGLSPTFTWEGSVNTERTQSHTLRHQDGNFSYWSNITFTPSPRDHNSPLSCTVTYKHGSAEKSITLNVEYLNKPDIFPIKKLIAGEQVTLTCTIFGNCMETSPTITWAGNINITNVGNYQLLQPSDNATYVSHVTFTPSQTAHNTSLTCTVTCKGTSTNHSTILDVEYLKEPDISPTKYLIAGEEVTLTCTAPTNCPGLSPTFTWEGSVNTERTQMYELPQQHGNVIYRSNITFTPSPRDHHSPLSCTVTYKHGSTEKSITLNVECKSFILHVFSTHKTNCLLFISAPSTI
uniref:Ig-like domain-containing protein n=1 Tax=Xenopus tropicalis TaxID=8364 RepID=A0A7D9NJX9_XENTR